MIAVVRTTSRLWSVPAQAGPVVSLELGNSLLLSKRMRARLRAAVRALVSAPALADASDGAAACVGGADGVVEGPRPSQPPRDMDATSFELWSTSDGAATPGWLAD